ncbi:MAG: TIGR04283 family arsenosugar biosynthesis glycosyltransferase [Candidatus Promineifilaceae bacterium]|nr:TIGR04283 family arsenosugar biosynthesis glycosyltransferase [Candidatus Promineifilaceae bacterium]
MRRDEDVRFSVVIPTLNEATVIGEQVRRTLALEPGAEVIVADGGSDDATAALAAQAGAIVVEGRRGRGSQLNAGAAQATGDVLLFLHADTQLPANAFSLLRERFAAGDAQIGTFRLAFDQAHWLFAVYTFFSRFDSVFTTFGDQCIVVRRSFFLTLGGFPDWPLFEDVALLQKARRQTRVHSFPAAVVTSARRFEREGIVRQSLRNGWYVLRYLLGASPWDLAASYEREGA